MARTKITARGPEEARRQVEAFLGGLHADMKNGEGGRGLIHGFAGGGEAAEKALWFAFYVAEREGAGRAGGPAEALQNAEMALRGLAGVFRRCAARARAMADLAEDGWVAALEREDKKNHGEAA